MSQQDMFASQEDEDEEMDETTKAIREHERQVQQQISQLQVDATWGDLYCYCDKEQLDFRLFYINWFKEFKKLAKYSPFEKYSNPADQAENFFNMKGK